MHLINTRFQTTWRLISISVVITVAGLFAALSYKTAAQETSTPPAPSNSPSASPSPTPNPNLPTLFVVGDSTANNNARGARGWGDPFAAYFDRTKINVVNRARAGRSSRTFITEGLWDRVLADMKPGDFVLIQFGHNDAGAINDASRARGSLPGTGEETEEIDNLLTKKHEVVHTYGWYLRKLIADTKAKGATPILLSLTVRNIWKDGRVERGSGRFGQWAAEVARSQNVLFLDLTKAVADKYEQLGQEKVKEFFGPDHTHTSPAGAELNAATVVALLKGMKESPFVKYLSPEGQRVEAIAQESGQSPRRPLPVPANPRLPTLFLIGDSTVRNGQGDGAGGQWGWGEPLAAYFDATKINVVNRAVGGLSSRTYLTGGHWDKVLEMLKPGDIVMMQFGHNDSGPYNDTSRARGSIRGMGEETEEIDNLLTKKHEVVHTYGWYLRKFIQDTKAKGATPIVCSLVPRKIWKDGRIVRSEDYAVWAREVARSEGVAFIDLNEIIAAKYDAMGPEKVDAMFADPHTHTSLAGAELNASMVVSGLKALKKNPLAPYFSDRARSVSKAKVSKRPTTGS
ncbi:MAG TPA: rhamnogalacturonan acetylesterase [Pyrinomonadaceae bacterium]|jgi:lysophospholipase L1-like esterase